MWVWLLFLGACGRPDPVPVPVPVPLPAPVPVAEIPEPPPLPEPPPVVPSAPKYAATHVLIAWAGAVGAPPTVTRSEAEALTLAEDVHRRATAGEPLEDLARAHSDDGSAPRGGSLGVYLTNTMVPEFEAAVAGVPVGAIAPVVRTPFGYHVVRRDAVVEITASHVLVGWAGAWRATSTRTQAEARARIEEALARLDAGEPFASVAATYSEDVTAPWGGDLGTFEPGTMIPAFEEAAFALAPGQRSGIVETPYGYHVILRTK